MATRVLARGAAAGRRTTPIQPPQRSRRGGRTRQAKMDRVASSLRRCASATTSDLDAGATHGIHGDCVERAKVGAPMASANRPAKDQGPLRRQAGCDSTAPRTSRRCWTWRRGRSPTPTGARRPAWRGRRTPPRARTRSPGAGTRRLPAPARRSPPTTRRRGRSPPAPSRAPRRKAACSPVARRGPTCGPRPWGTTTEPRPRPDGRRRPHARSRTAYPTARRERSPGWS